MSTQGYARNAWALGGTVFAAALLIMIGVWQVFLGIAAIAADRFFIVDPSYAYEFSPAAWGWIHLLLGILLFVAGFALFTGALWARLVGIFLAVLSGIAHFLFLPYYPIASLVAILVAIFIIWSLATVEPPPEQPGVRPAADGGATTQEAPRPPQPETGA